MDFFFTLIAVLFISIALTYSFGRMAPLVGLQDRPNQPRKKHERVAALIGGLSIFISWIFGVSLISPIGSPLLTAAVILIIAGVLDDYCSISPLKKLAAQFLAAGILVLWGKILLLDLGNVLPDGGTLRLGAFAALFTIIALLLLLNAWNFIDGLDGLAGGVSIITLFWLCVIGVLSGPQFDILPALLLMIAIGGFLPFNLAWKKLGINPVFLGDAGSLVTGLIVGWFAITLAAQPVVNKPPAILIAWVLAFPVFDLICVAVRRVAAGRSPFRADKTHFHHLLCRRGMKPLQATLSILVVVFGFGLAGMSLWLSDVGENVMAALLLLAFGAQFIISARLTNIRR